MSMPHVCRCAICGQQMSPFLVQTQTVGHTGKVEYQTAQHAIKVETYRVVRTDDAAGKPT